MVVTTNKVILKINDGAGIECESINDALAKIKAAGTGDDGVNYTIQLDGTFDEAVVLDWAETNDIAFVKAEGAAKAEITGKVNVGTDRYNGSIPWSSNLTFDGITFDYSDARDNLGENPDWAAVNGERFEILCIGRGYTLNIVDCNFNGPGVIDGTFNGGQPNYNNGTEDGSSDGNLFGTPHKAVTNGNQGYLVVENTTFSNGNLNFWRNSDQDQWKFINCTFDNAPVTLMGNPGKKDYLFTDCTFKMDLSKVDGDFATYLVGMDENALGVELAKSEDGKGCTMTITGTNAEGREVSYILTQAPNTKDATENPTTAKLIVDGVVVAGEIPADVSFITAKSPADTRELDEYGKEITLDQVFNSFAATDLKGVTAEDVNGAANVEISNTLEDGTVQKITTDAEGVVNESLTNTDKTLYLNGESYTADLEYKIITANSGKNTFDGNDVSAKNVYVGYSSDEAADLALVNGAHVFADTQIVLGSDSKLTVDADSMLETRGDCLQVRGTAVFDGGLKEDQKVSQELVASEEVQGKLNYLQVYPTGDMQLVNGAAVSTKAHVDVYNKLSIDNSRFETASQAGKWLSGAHTNHYGGFYIRENGVVSVSNGGLLAVGGEYRGKGYALYNEGTLEVKNGAQTVVSFNAVNAKDIKVSNGGVLKVGANFIADTTFNDFSLVNNGTIEVAGGIVEAGTVTNECDFTVTGDSVLQIQKVTGKEINLAGSLINSNVGGHILVNGNSSIKADDDENTKDITTVSGTVKVVNGSTLTVEEGAELKDNYLIVGDAVYGVDFLDYGAGQEKVGGNLIVEGKVTTNAYFNAASNGNITIADGGVVDTTAVTLEKAGITDETAKAGTLTIEDGGTLKTANFGVYYGAVANIDGTLELKLQSPMMVVSGSGSTVNVTGNIDLIQNENLGEYDALTLSDGAKFNVNGGSVDFVVDGNSYSNLNINSAELKVTGNGTFKGENVNLNDADAKLTVDGGTVSATSVTNNGSVTVNGGTFTAGAVDTNRRLKIVRDGDVSAAATATVEFYSAYGKTGTKTVSFEAGKDTVYLDVDAFSYKYKVICNGVTKEYSAGNAEFEFEGDFEVAGKTTLAIEDLIGTATVKDNALVTGSVVSRVANSINVVGKNVTFSNFKLNEGITDYNSAQLEVQYGSELNITDNSYINATNAFSVRGGKVNIDAGSSVKTYNFEVRDGKGTPAVVTIDGTVDAASFLVVTVNESASKVVVNADATLNLATWGGNGRLNLQAGAMTVYGYVNANYTTGGGAAGYGGIEDFKLTIDGTYAAEDNNNGKFVNIGNQKFQTWDSTITLKNNALFDWAADVDVSGTKIDIQSGSTFKTSSALNNWGTITMDADSLITAGSIAGTGTITIDANGFDGVKKVVDITGAGQEWAEGQLVFKNLGETQVAYGADGDVVLANVDTKILYVNSAWATADKDPDTEGVQNYEVGDEVAEGLYYGFNAVAEFTDNGTNDKGWSNLLVLPEGTTEVVLTAGNENASYGMLRPTQSITVKTEGEGYAVIDRFVNMGCDLTFAEGSKVKVIGNVGLSGANNQGGTVTINGEVYMAIAPNNGNKALYLWGMNGTPGQLVINAGGILKADCANVENHGTITVYGTMELGKLGDAPKLAGVGANNGGWHGHLIVDGKDGEGIVSVAHNQLNFGGGNTSVDWQEPAGDCSVDIINGGKITTAAVSFRNGAKNTLTINNGTLEFTNDPDYANLTPRYFDNQGIINVTNGTLDMSDRNLDNTGSITISGSTFSADSLTNNGEFTVKGASQLIVDAASGNAIKLDNGAVLTDSKIYSADYTKGGAEVWVAGNAVMNGTYEGNLTRVSGANAKLTINGTYTATNGGYYQLTVGGTSNWHMDRYYNGSYADGGALVVSKDASVTVDCLSIVANGSASIAGNVTVASQFELSNGNISNAQAGKLTVETGATLNGAVFTDIYGTLTVNGSYVVSPIAELAPYASFMVHEGGSVNIVNGSFTIDNFTAKNAGTITISGESTVNATVAGKGAVVLDWWATLGGDLKLTGDAALKLNGYASLADDAAINGKLVDGVLMVKGSGNSIKLADGTTTVLQLADGTVLDAETDDLGDAKIQGEWWGVTFTVDDAVLAGNTVAAGAFMNITNADKFIKVDADITQIKTINGFAVEKLGEMYYYVDGEGVTNLITATSSGFDISKKVKPDDDVTPDKDPVATGLNSIYVAEETTALANSNIEMAAGYTNIVTGSGAWSEDKTNNMDVAFGSIQKDSDKGGINEIYVGSNVDMAINGNVDSMGSASVGANSSLDVRNNINGQNNGQSIYVGYNADMTVGADMDLKGGWNSLSVDYKGDLDVTGNVENVASLGIYSGVEDKKATIGGDFIAPLYNSNINVGYMSSLTITGDIVNGVKPAAGTYECLGTGTYISVGYDAEFGAKDIYGLSGMYADGKSVVTVGNIYGTMYGNGIYVAGESFTAGNIDLKGGWNSFGTGYMTEASVGSIKNVASISTGWGGDLTVAGDITGVQSLNVAGNWGSMVDFSVNGAVTAADWAYFYVGSYVDADFKAGITFGTTYDSLNIGSYSSVNVDGDVANIDNVYVGWGSSLKVGGDITGVQSLNVAGNWDARVSFSAANITAADWSYVGIGSFVDAKIVNITFGTTWDTMNIGYKSTVEIADVDFSNLDALYADATATLKVNNGKGNDVDLSKVGGWWQGATILDEEGELEASNSGSVYANEWDVYEIGDTVTQVKLNSATAGIKYEISEDGGVNWREYNLTNSSENIITAGDDNLLRVSVTTGFNDETKKAAYSFELLA